MKYEVWTFIEKISSKDKAPQKVGEIMKTGVFRTQKEAEEYQIKATVDCVYKYMDEERK